MPRAGVDAALSVGAPDRMWADDPAGALIAVFRVRRIPGSCCSLEVVRRSGSGRKKGFGEAEFELGGGCG